MKRLLLASGIVLSLLSQRALPAVQTATAPAKTGSAKVANKSSRHPTGALPDSAREAYLLAWGVDQLSVKLAESGQLVRFSYRVIDVRKAQPLHDRASEPALLDEKEHAVLQVPTMEKVGPLRQSQPPEYGKSYWMAFSNKGSIVKAGHRVSIVIGAIRLDGLIVQP
jgi:hypothetical protein